MRIYTAGEAIGPAWEHTKALLFQPREGSRRWPRLLKLCCVAIGAQLGFNFSTNLGRSHTSLPGAALPLFLLFAVLGGALSFVISIALLYLGSRLQFVLFDVILLRDDSVGPAWARHGHQAWRWAGIKVVAILVLAAVLSPLLIPALVGVFALVHAVTPATPGAVHFGFPAFRAIAVVALQLLGVFLLFSVFYRLFVTVTLPGVALEDLSFTAAFRRAGELLRTDIPGMLFYAVLQMLLVFALGLAALLCWAIACGIVALPFGLAAWALWTVAHTSTAGMFVFGTVAAIAGFALLVAAVLSYVVLLGTLSVFAETYSLYFLGGRYPLLGSYLEPQPTPVLGFRE